MADDASTTAKSSTEEVLRETLRLREELERVVARLDNYTLDLRRAINRHHEQGERP